MKKKNILLGAHVVPVHVFITGGLGWSRQAVPAGLLVPNQTHCNILYLRPSFSHDAVHWKTRAISIIYFFKFYVYNKYRRTEYMSVITSTVAKNYDRYCFKIVRFKKYFSNIEIFLGRSKICVTLIIVCTKKKKKVTTVMYKYNYIILTWKILFSSGTVNVFTKYI